MTQQIAWFAMGTVLNIGLAGTFEWLRPNNLTYDGLWNARIGVWAGLLLVDNIALLWWYANLTRQQVDGARAQCNLLERQLKQAQDEFRHSQALQLVSFKPVVYIERIENPDYPANVDYAIRNAGGGAAINVYYIGLQELAFNEPRSIGSVAPGDSRVLPRAINTILQEGHASVRFLLLAEAHYTRTTQWTPTLHVRTQTRGRHAGQVLYRTATVAVPTPSREYQSLAAYLVNNRQHLAEQLIEFAREGAAE
jgi:hypothetical protein